jgi:hypothetical protein
LINDTDFIGTTHVGIGGIASLSTINTIAIYPSHGAKLNEPSWTILPISLTMTQTMHLWKFRKTKSFSVLYMCD